MLKASQLKEVLYHIIHNNKALEAEGKKKCTIQVQGESGIGKTSIIIQVARELGMNFSKYNPSQTDDAGDITGMPIREFECLVDDSLVWINEKALDHAPKGTKFTGKNRTSTCAPSWVPTQPGTILLIDDWNRAHLHIIQALMEVVDRGESVGWKLPPDTHIILSANPEDKDYFVTSMDKAQRTRYTSVSLGFNVEEWAQWAEHEGVDTRCINFLLLNPEMINPEKDVNARLATQFFDNLYTINDFSTNFGLISLLGEGSVGNEFTQTFILFINNKLDRLPSPQSIMNLKTSDESVIKMLQKVCGAIESKEYKTSIAAVISTRIINYCDKLLLEKKLNKIDHVERIKKILLGDVFMKDVNFNIIKTLNAHKQFARLISDTNIVQEVLS